MAFNYNRSDLSNWLIHFVHNRNIACHPNDIARDMDLNIDDLPYPVSYSFNGVPHYDDYISHYNDRMRLCDDESAFGVLKKIIYSGYIHTSWSFRNHKATIYGPKAAVCFTEMPLHNLVDYVQQRNNSEFVSCYGIAFKREELFSLGARPVIYGISSPHKEAVSTDVFFGKGLRTLDSSCGVSLKEQYRYVYTNLQSTKPTDWMHEREWRWADINESYDIPALPFLLDILKGNLTTIIVIVQTDDEVDNLLSTLKINYDAESNFSDILFRKTLLACCRFVSFESIKKQGISLSQLNLDTLPKLNVSKKMKIVRPTAETVAKVKKAVEEANRLSLEASKSYYESAKKSPEGHVLDICGFAFVVTHNPYSEITQTLIELDLVKNFGENYQLWLKTYPEQSISVAEAGISAAANYLTETLGQNFYCHSMWD